MNCLKMSTLSLPRAVTRRGQRHQGETQQLHRDVILRYAILSVKISNACCTAKARSFHISVCLRYGHERVSSMSNRLHRCYPRWLLAHRKLVCRPKGLSVACCMVRRHVLCSVFAMLLFVSPTFGALPQEHSFSSVLWKKRRNVSRVDTLVPTRSHTQQASPHIHLCSLCRRCYCRPSVHFLFLLVDVSRSTCMHTLLQLPACTAQCNEVVIGTRKPYVDTLRKSGI
jgi:hypothetical protein